MQSLVSGCSQTSASSMNLIKNTSKISHWFLFLVATNPEHIQSSGSSTIHTHSNSRETFSSLKAVRRGDPQFHPFANILRTVLVFVISQVPLHMQKSISSSSSQPNSSVKPPQTAVVTHQLTKTKLPRSPRSTLTHHLIQHLPSTQLDIYFLFYGKPASVSSPSAKIRT